MTPIDRRAFVLGAASLAGAVTPAHAETAPTVPAANILHLWPGAPPGGPGPSGLEQVTPSGALSNVIVPRLAMRRPDRPNGTAVLIVAGGGYRRIAIAHEAEPTAAWLAAQGVTPFILYYRLPNRGWPKLAPFQDAQRAMRLIRAGAAGWGLDPKRIGILGYSAGGHCAGMTAVRPGEALYAPVDAADDVSARPDFAGLIYPVVTMLPPSRTKASTLTLLGPDPTPADCAAMSVERLVTGDAPPMFLAHAGDDPTAPVENSLLMYTALRTARVPAELHIFRSGGHAFDLGRPQTDTRVWPDLFADWAGFAKS